jgi:hypothetical protein
MTVQYNIFKHVGNYYKLAEFTWIVGVLPSRRRPVQYTFKKIFVFIICGAAVMTVDQANMFQEIRYP